MLNQAYSQRSQSMYSQSQPSRGSRRRNNGRMKQGLMIAGQNMTCIPLSQVQRMKNLIKDDVDPVRELIIQEKLRMKKLSNKRTKNWGDTTEAKKRIKAQKKFLIFKKEETLKREIDRKETAYQNKLSTQVIGKANRQIFAHSDKVKCFNGKLMIADCLKEREFQIAINHRKEQMNQMLEQQHLDMLAEGMRRQDEIEQAKLRALQVKKRKNAKVLQEQHDAMKMKYIKRMQEERIEGEVIKRHAQEAIEKEHEEEEKRRQKRLKIVAETKKANEALQQLRREQVLKEAEEERQIELYAKRKQARKDMMKQREQERFREKQEQRQRLIDKQVARLQQMKDEEESRIGNQIVEARKKKEAMMKKREEKRKSLKHEMDHFTSVYWKKKNREAKIQKDKDRQFQAFWTSYNKKLHEQEQETQANRRQRNRDLHNYHQMQARQKQAKIEAELLQEMKEARKMKFAIEQEDKQFNSWAEECLAKWKDDGKNVTPLLLELTKNKNAHKSLKFC